jgi:hypothetical protein
VSQSSATSMRRCPMRMRSRSLPTMHSTVRLTR